jgi:CRISPR type I-E-associated protein CasB/Cse2
MSKPIGSLHLALAEAARAWWRAHLPGGADGRRGDPATFARLRRCGRPVEALAEAATVELWRSLPDEFRNGRDRDEKLARAAALAHVLAFVREDTHREGTQALHPMRQLGPQKSSEPQGAKLKPLRLRQLLAAREPEELAQAFRRLVTIADRRIDVGELAAALLLWDDRVRTRWAFTWHDAAWAAPGADETLPEAA